MNRTRIVKKWEVFPGKNRFCCDGRIITGRQQSVFLFTLFLIIGVTTLFFIFDGPYLTKKLSLAIPMIEAVVFVFVMLFLFRTSWTDPGILPRATPEEAAYNERQIDRLIQSELHQVPRVMEVVIKGVVTKLKFCTTCKIFRPPRASHCSVCDNCVERFDHHCPWVGNCIGKRNYRYFYLFLVLVTIDCCYILSFSITSLVLRSIDKDFVNALKESPGSIIEAVITFFALWSVIGLTGFHTFLASCNITTNEDIKNLYSTSGQKNPFSHGSFVRNYLEVICGPLLPSLIDRRGLVTGEFPMIFPPNSQGSNLPIGLATTAIRVARNRPDRVGHRMPSHLAGSRNYMPKSPPASRGIPPLPRGIPPLPRGLSSPTRVLPTSTPLSRHNNLNNESLFPDVVVGTDITSVTIQHLGDA